MRRGCTGLLACAVALGISGLASAMGLDDPEPLVVALEYSAAPDCPGLSDFKAIATGRLGYDPFREGVPDRVLVQIEARGPANEGRIEWRDAEGRWAGDRRFPSRSADCRELARAMAFSLALQIQLLARASASAALPSAPPAEGPPAAETGAPPTMPVPPPAAPASPQQREGPAPIEAAASPDQRPHPVLALGAGALVGFGLSSSLVPMGRAFGNLAWPYWSLELAAEVSWPSTVRRADGAGFSQQALLLGAAGCRAIAPASACLVAKAGALRIDGTSIDVPASRLGPLVEAGLRLAVVQSLGRRLYMSAQTEGLLIVTRWRVTLDQNVVWTSPRLAATLGLDLGVRFP